MNIRVQFGCNHICISEKKAFEHFPIGFNVNLCIAMNVHWMVLYNLKVFCSDMKFKMADTAGLSLTLDPMGKMFQNASSLKPLGQLKPNCPGMIIGRSSTKLLFYMPIGNPRWPPPSSAVAAILNFISEQKT
jgi:hypothetical protein